MTDTMNIRFTITEREFKRLINAPEADDFFGGVEIGDFCFEIHTGTDRIPFIDGYVQNASWMDVDNAYGYTSKNRTPYEYADDRGWDVTVPHPTYDFEEFKANLLANIFGFIEVLRRRVVHGFAERNSYREYAEHLFAPLADWE